MLMTEVQQPADGTRGEARRRVRVSALVAAVACAAVLFPTAGCRRRSGLPSDPVERLALARNLVRRNEVEKALEVYKSLIDSKAPNRSRIALEAALVCRRQGMIDGVLYFTDFVDEQAPERRTADELVVDALLTRGDRSQLEYFLRRKWKNPATRLWAAPFLAELLMQEGSRDEALDIYATLIREHPEREEEWRLARARLCMKAGDSARARAEFDAILRKNPRSASALLGLATLAVADHDWDEAEDLFRKALAAAPENPDARLGLAFVLLSKGRVRQAGQLYEQVLASRNPPYLKLLPYLDLLFDQRNWKRLGELAAPAASAARAAGGSESSPASGPAGNGSNGDRNAPLPPQERTGPPATAGNRAGKKGEKAPRAVFALYARALLELAHNEYDAARKSLADLLAIEPDPPDVQVFVRYARLLLRAGKVTEARKVLEHARRIGPLPDTGLLLLAEIALEEGRFHSAMRLARTAGPGNPRAAMILARCEAAMGRVDEALRVLQGGETTAKKNRTRQNVTDTARLLLEADQLEKSGDYRRAEKLLERIAATSADRPAALLARAKQAWAAGRKQEAARILDRLLAVLPDGSAKIAAWKLRLRTALVLGDVRTARSILAELRKRDVPNLELYEGWLAAVEGNWTKAVDVLKNSTIEYGWDGVVRFLLLGLAALRTGDMKGTATAFDSALDALASPPPGLYVLARDANILAGDIAAAIPCAEAVVRLRRDDPEAVVILSRLYADTGKRTARLKLLEDAVERFPERAGILLEYCRALLAAGEFARAETAARDALKRFPQEAGFRLCLLQTLLLQRRSADLKEAAKSLPPDSPAGITAGVILALDRIYARVPEEARRIVENLPADDPRVRLVRAWIDLIEGRRDDARKELETLTAKSPDMFQAHLLLGNLYSTQGMYDKAADELRKCLALAPDSVVALNNLAWVLVRERKSLSEAYGCAAKARRLAPESPEVNDTFAAAALATGDWKAALEAALEAARANPAKFWPWAHAAEAALKLERPKEAVVYLRKAAEAAKTREQRRTLAALRQKMRERPAAPAGG